MRTVSLLFHDVFTVSPRESGFQSAAADRYKLTLDDFEAQLDGIPGVEHLHPVRITVDDGGVSFYRLVADRLEARGWRGHAFVPTDAIGSRGFLDAAQIRELDTRGHTIGSHSASHPRRLSAYSAGQIRQEWSRSRQVLEDLLGHEVVSASVPGGYYSRRVALAARDAGIGALFTSEPTPVVRSEGGVVVLGRFTIRRGHPPDAARRLLLPAPWARLGAWASWNAKGLVKPLLGSSYMRVADWIHGNEERV
jgi:peptidoglycan/xylan/chitin deacetylase (PgdA/CDA1 family)